MFHEQKNKSSACSVRLLNSYVEFNQTVVCIILRAVQVSAERLLPEPAEHL